MIDFILFFIFFKGTSPVYPYPLSLYKPKSDVVNPPFSLSLFLFLYYLLSFILPFFTVANHVFPADPTQGEETLFFVTKAVKALGDKATLQEENEKLKEELTKAAMHDSLSKGRSKQAPRARMGGEMYRGGHMMPPPPPPSRYAGGGGRSSGYHSEL